MHTVLVTGAAGYVGMMVVSELAKRDDVTRVIALDKDEQPETLKTVPKVHWITANTSEPQWEENIAAFAPTAVIHTAWQIREMYGKKKLQWRWNVEGSERVFSFACRIPSVRRMVHFSTASVYGAYPTNTLGHLFKEDETLREDEYLYGIEKKIVEERLQMVAKNCKKQIFGVAILRPAAITGPYGRSLTHRFGLQSVLTGKVRGSFVYTLARILVSRIPATAGWCRQFIHEDDVVDVAIRLALAENVKAPFQIFNLAPQGVVLPEDMAEVTGKKLLYLPLAVIRLGYFIAWHVTRGRIPTSSGSWKFYSYPVVLDGSAVERDLGFSYRCSSKEAFISREGRYAPT